MRNVKKLVSAVAAAVVFAAPLAAQAVDLNFNGAVSNGSLLAQSYGDGATWNVTYADLTSPGLSLKGWNSGYQGTNDVLYAGSSDANSHGRITITPSSGYQVTVNSFDLTPYLPNNANGFSSQWAVYGAGGIPSFASVGLSNVLTTYSPSFSSNTGVVIEWKTSAYNVGIDNINFSVTAVPEPETYAMFLAGLGLMGAIAKRRKSKQV